MYEWKCNIIGKICKWCTSYTFRSVLNNIGISAVHWLVCTPGNKLFSEKTAKLHFAHFCEAETAHLRRTVIIVFGKQVFFQGKKFFFKKRLHRKTEMLLRHFCKSISPPFYGVSFGNCVFGVWQYSICLFFESFLLTFRSECCILLFTIFHSFGGIAQLVRAFGSHPKGRGFEPPCVHHIRTKVMIPLVLQLSFFLSKQALFLTISKNNSILFMMSFSHRRLRSVSSGERGARHCAELLCGTATVDIVPP